MYHIAKDASPLPLNLHGPRPLHRPVNPLNIDAMDAAALVIVILAVCRGLAAGCTPTPP